MNIKYKLLHLLLLLPLVVSAQRQEELLAEGWKFHLGNSSSAERDFRNGTEYFNYLTKAHSIHNEGPYVMKFDDSEWKSVRIPHDWVLQLPYASEASHSHGYRTVGWKYPETSVGWYRKVFRVYKEDLDKHIELQFDGIFRNSEIWVNGFYLSGERSGYISHYYDISDYLEYEGKKDADGKEYGENLICVRADASLEEGWFYEGAGIYRDVRLVKTGKAHIKTNGIFVYPTFPNGDYGRSVLQISAEVENTGIEPVEYKIRQTLYDPEGNKIGDTWSGRPMEVLRLEGKATGKYDNVFGVGCPELWDTNHPVLYKLVTRVYVDKKVTDECSTNVGIRSVEFSADRGFLLNGKSVKLKGVNMHQDHAGVGAAIPGAVNAWRIKQLKALGCNAYRASHNPMTPALLDICDKEGMLVIDENRLMGVNDYHLRQLESMIRRDRNHPCIIMWSDGNEEWGLENSAMGTRLAASMREYTHRLDPSRPVTVANAGGAELIKGLEVVGYNYIVQNDVDNRHKQHPDWKVVGTEETTACGTRGVYYSDPQGRWMPSINRTDPKYENIIERGWKFYNERPWAAGLFYWTGFDYRGEPNPLGYPAVGSQFGILDYCGFPKDEAYYLKSWWTNETVLHIFPHWNLHGHEGENVDIWAYSNCDQVELYANGKNLGKKKMPKAGHLKWTAKYQPGSLRAVGYKNGKKVKEVKVETTGPVYMVSATPDRAELSADGRDVAIVTISLKDKRGRVVPTACNEVRVSVEGDASILGAGNGDPSFKGEEHPADESCKSFTIPAFNGYAQVLVRAGKLPGIVAINCNVTDCQSSSITLATRK